MRLYTMHGFHVVKQWLALFQALKLFIVQWCAHSFIVYIHNALDVLMHYFSPEVTIKMALWKDSRTPAALHRWLQRKWFPSWSFLSEHDFKSFPNISKQQLLLYQISPFLLDLPGVTDQSFYSFQAEKRLAEMLVEMPSIQLLNKSYWGLFYVR